MSKAYVLSYQDFGALLVDEIFAITIRKYDKCDYNVYENVLTKDKLCLIRRFFKAPVNLFEDDHSEALLPEDIVRFEMTYEDIPVIVVGSLDMDNLFKDKGDKNQYGMVAVDDSLVTCKPTDLEHLAEDVVLLASNGIDLNEPNLE